MKSLLLAFAAGAIPAAAAPLSVAVFPFETAAGVDPSYGQAFAGLLRTDLALLPPFRRQDPPAGVAPVRFDGAIGTADAAEIGRQTGADAFVTGQVIRQGDNLIVAVKTIDAKTGQASGASLQQPANQPVTFLAGMLAERTGSLLLHRSPDTAATLWPEASIQGCRLPSPLGISLAGAPVAWIRAIDGHAVAGGRNSWSASQRFTPGRHQLAATFADGQEHANFDFFWDAPPAGRAKLKAHEDGNHGVTIELVADSDSRPMPLLAVDPKSHRLGAYGRLELRLTGGRPDEEVIDTRMFDFNAFK